MKTETHSINDILTKNATSFFIPPFQRSYAWGKDEIERYFDDVKRIVKSLDLWSICLCKMTAGRCGVSPQRWVAKDSECWL